MKLCDDPTMASHRPPPRYGGGGILSQIGAQFGCSKNRYALRENNTMEIIENSIPIMKYLFEMTRLDRYKLNT